MKTILLTGASGYLGQHFKQYYSNSGCQVITIGRRAEDDIFWDAHQKRTLSGSDLSFPIDRIVHCAAVNETMINDSAETSFDVNVTLTKTLCNVAKELNVKEFIYISTFHVYGLSHGTVGPSVICRPINDYGLTHYLSEEILRHSLRGTDIATLCLRPTNIYGMPSNIKNFSRWSLVPFHFVRTALETNNIRLMTRGMQERNFVDVCNVVEAEPNKAGFEVRDIFGSETMSIKDFARCVVDTLEVNFGISVELILPDESVETFTEKNKPLNFESTIKDYQPKGSIKKFILEFASLLIIRENDY